MRLIIAPVPFALGFALFATLALTACGGEDSGPDEPNPTDDTVTVVQPGPNGECPNGALKQDTSTGPQCLSTTQPAVTSEPSPDKEPDPTESDAAPEPEEDATAPPDEPSPVEELHSCSDYMNDPGWAWVAQANGLRFMCGQTECTFELSDGPDGCEAKCQPEFYELLTELEHMGGTSFQHNLDGVGTITCNAM